MQTPGKQTIASVTASSRPRVCLQEGCPHTGLLWITLLDHRTGVSNSAACCVRHWRLVELLLQRGGFAIQLDQRARALLASAN